MKSLATLSPLAFRVLLPRRPPVALCGMARALLWFKLLGLQYFVTLSFQVRVPMSVSHHTQLNSILVRFITALPIPGLLEVSTHWHRGEGGMDHPAETMWLQP